MARSRPLVAGNWKMNGSKLNLADLEALKAGIRDSEGVDVAVCPPATLISRASVVVANSPILIGGQDCHPQPSGAHTGDISAEMLADAGARVVIVGENGAGKSTLMKILSGVYQADSGEIRIAGQPAVFENPIGDAAVELGILQRMLGRREALRTLSLILSRDIVAASAPSSQSFRLAPLRIPAG